MFARYTAAKWGTSNMAAVTIVKTE